ncbi:MAG TPA: hypothetical protein VL333_01235 [Candidatus Saccharimonadales bacterium]|nr:hypothetical protein [Candidatus Saccharimonadales bacterium]
MLAKLLSLLIHAKAGLVSGVLLLGATGALVTVSTANNVTTVTITQPSASPSALTVTATRSPKPSESPEPSESPKLSSSTSSACSDAAKALSLQVQRVDNAFSGFHTDLVHLRGTRSVVVIETADVMLKNVRQAAVKALHATLSTTCTQTDDEDKADEDKAESDDEDSSTAASDTTSLNTDREKDEDSDGEAKTATTPITFTGTDAASIADQAIAAMQAAFDTAKSAAASTPKPSRSPRVPQSSHTPESRGDDD